ncbi:MAG: hypothetical protein KC708_18265 [Anaerolineae bacterium]|nr:hypothetical protein [Anaerolineae bacterium]
MNDAKYRKRLEWLLKGAGLLATWAFIYFFLVLETEFILVPWDTTLIRPDIGTWQRTLNDFFEVGIGSWIIPAGVVIANMLMALRLLRRRRILPWKFIINNALFVWMFIPMMLLVAQLNNTIFPPTAADFEPGYYRSIIPGLVVVLLTSIWFMVQGRLLDKRKRKRQATDVTSVPDASRLADSGQVTGQLQAERDSNLLRDAHSQ